MKVVNLRILFKITLKEINVPATKRYSIQFLNTKQVFCNLKFEVKLQ